MLTSFNDLRSRGYDDRNFDRHYEGYEGPEYSRDHSRQARLLDSRSFGYDRPTSLRGDWMRESPWMRDWYWGRQDVEIVSTVKVLEVVAQSPHSWEDAVRRAVAEASRTVGGIRSVYVQDMQAVVEDGQVLGFRVSAKISFALDEYRRRR